MASSTSEHASHRFPTSAVRGFNVRARRVDSRSPSPRFQRRARLAFTPNLFSTTGALSFARRSQVQATPSSNRGASNVGSVKSSSHIGEPRRRANCLAMSRAVRVRTSHAARTLTSSWRLPQSNIISAGGQARDFSHQNRDIKEQETGVDLALKLPQIAPISTTPGGC